MTRPDDSDFGRGYATCLFQFLNHRARLAETLTFYTRMHRQHPDLFDDSRAVEVWANGASDHLYELSRPVALPSSEWTRAARLAARALDIGHSFGPPSESDAVEAHFLLAEAAELLSYLEARGHSVATLADCLTTDQALGLEPDVGTWNCPVNLSRTVVA